MDALGYATGHRHWLHRDEVRSTADTLRRLPPASGQRLLNTVSCRHGQPSRDVVTVYRDPAPSASMLARWDRLIERVPGTDVTQLSAWARTRAWVGYCPVYLLAHRDDALVGGALLLHRRVAGVLTIGYLPYGPVIDPEAADRAAVTTALADALRTLASELSMTFIQPPEGAHDISTALIERGFRDSRAGTAPAGSYRLDLTPPLDTIRSTFSKRLKSWTNRWESKGVHIRKGTETDLPLLVQLMVHTGSRQGFTPPTLDYLRTLYTQLASSGHAALFIGEVHGHPVSADLVTVAGGMVRGRFGGFDARGDAGKLSVPAAARWQIIKWAKQQGQHWLDFGGLPEPMLADMLDHGITSSEHWPPSHRAKLAFNGTAFRYPQAVELIRPTPLQSAYDLATTHPMGQRGVAIAKTLLRGGH